MFLGRKLIPTVELGKFDFCQLNGKEIDYDFAYACKTYR